MWFEDGRRNVSPPNQLHAAASRVPDERSLLQIWYSQPTQRTTDSTRVPTVLFGAGRQWISLWWRDSKGEGDMFVVYVLERSAWIRLRAFIHCAPKINLSLAAQAFTLVIKRCRVTVRLRCLNPRDVCGCLVTTYYNSHIRNACWPTYCKVIFSPFY